MRRQLAQRSACVNPVRDPGHDRGKAAQAPEDCEDAWEFPNPSSPPI